MLIAIRDNQPRPATEAEAPAAVRSKARAADSARSPTIAAPEELQSEVAVPAPPTNLPAPHRRSALSDGAPADRATPAPFAEYAPPPAPAAAAPPPPATAKAQEEAVETENASADQQIVVTGSRVEAPRSVAARPFEPLSVSGPRSAAENVRGVLADPAYRTFFAQLQGAVRANDRQMVVALARMPLRVNFNGRSQTYRDTKTLVADYERVFTPKVRRAILAQRYESLFTRDQGLMIGSGEVWFDRVCRDRNCVRGPVRIIAVNP